MWLFCKTRWINLVGHPTLLCNFIEIALRHGCSLVNLLHIFRTPFSRNSSECLLLCISQNISNIIYIQYTSGNIYSTFWFLLQADVTFEVTFLVLSGNVLELYFISEFTIIVFVQRYYCCIEFITIIDFVLFF